MKKTTKKPVKKATKLEAKVAELEKCIENIYIRLNHQQPVFKEPETFEDCVKTVGKVQPIMKLVHVTVPDKRTKQLAAIAKMMTVADALNVNERSTYKTKWGIMIDCNETIITSPTPANATLSGGVCFNSAFTAEKAIKILGEETIKTAFGLDVDDQFGLKGYPSSHKF